MGLIEKSVFVRWNSKSKKHYIEKGYTFTKSGDYFEAKVEDLTTGSHVKLACLCDNCKKVFKVEYCNYLINNVYGKYYCNKCAGDYGRKKYNENKLKTLVSFEQWCKNKDNDLLSLWDYEKNIVKPNEVSYRSNQDIWFKCPCGKHDSYKRKLLNSHSYNFRCPKCSRERNESMIQEKVRLYLESLGYTIEHENDCSIVPINPKTKYPLPFDNEIKELRLIIEVHGSQHYEKSVFTRTEEDLHYRKLLDRYKRIYCKVNNYHFLELSYKDIEKDNYKQIIDDKIADIISSVFK